VTVTPDQLTAYLEFSAGPPPTIEDALQSLADAQVTFGIDRARIVAGLGMLGRPVKAAVGRPAYHGVDGHVEYAATLLSIGGRPHVADDGNVDLFDLDLVHNVEDGAVLATRTLPTAGEPGRTVFGMPIPARPGRIVHVRAGTGARLSVDRLQVLAATAGHAALVGDVVSVSPVYHIRGDVGPATGNIDFVGSVSVSGNVDAGYRIRAGGDVEIQGSVAAGDVESAGNVSIRYGIRGHNGHGRVVAAGDVRAGFIEFAVVHAGGSVYASDGIMRSEVESGGRVEVLGQHGSIVGGHILARDAVSARDLGSSHDISTEIVVGADRGLLAEAQQSRVRATTLVRDLDQVQQRVVRAQDQARRRGTSHEGRHELEECHLLYKSLLEERAQLNLRQQELVQLLQALRSAEVVAQGTCYPEVRITIGTATHLVRDAWRNVRFRRNQATYEVEPIELA
jgi:uncharacterized protein (DUF342 family)